MEIQPTFEAEVLGSNPSCQVKAPKGLIMPRLKKTRVLTDSKIYFTEVSPCSDFVMVGLGTSNHSTFMGLKPIQARKIANAMLRYADEVEDK